LNATIKIMGALAASLSVAACGGDTIREGLALDVAHEPCTNDLASHIYIGVSAPDLAERISAVVHHLETRQETLVGALVTVQAVEGGVQAQAACSGGTSVDFVREL